MNASPIRLSQTLRARLETLIEATAQRKTDASVEPKQQPVAVPASQSLLKPNQSSSEAVMLADVNSNKPKKKKDKYPHYSVQKNVRDLLISAMLLSKLFERHQGGRERQQKLLAIIDQYDMTCEKSMKRSNNACKKP